MEEKKLEKRKNLEIIVLVVIIAVLLGALIYLLFIKKDNTNAQNSTSTYNNTEKSDNIVKTFVNYGTSEYVFSGYPSYADKNLKGTIIQPIKKLKFNSQNSQTFKIDDKLTIVFKRTTSEYDKDYEFDTFNVSLNGKELNLVNAKGEKEEFIISTEDDEWTKRSFDIYKLGQNYLLKGNYVAQSDQDYILLIDKDGNVTMLVYIGDYNKEMGMLDKIEYYSKNTTIPFYLITIHAVTDSSYTPDDYVPSKSTVYVYDE